MNADSSPYLDPRRHARDTDRLRAYSHGFGRAGRTYEPPSSPRILAGGDDLLAGLSTIVVPELPDDEVIFSMDVSPVQWRGIQLWKALIDSLTGDVTRDSSVGIRRRRSESRDGPEGLRNGVAKAERFASDLVAIIDDATWPSAFTIGSGGAERWAVWSRRRKRFERIGRGPTEPFLMPAIEQDVGCEVGISGRAALVSCMLSDLARAGRDYVVVHGFEGSARVVPLTGCEDEFEAYGALMVAYDGDPPNTLLVETEVGESVRQTFAFEGGRVLGSWAVEEGRSEVSGALDGRVLLSSPQGMTLVEDRVSAARLARGARRIARTIPGRACSFRLTLVLSEGRVHVADPCRHATCDGRVPLPWAILVARRGARARLALSRFRRSVEGASAWRGATTEDIARRLDEFSFDAGDLRWAERLGVDGFGRLGVGIDDFPVLRDAVGAMARQVLAGRTGEIRLAPIERPCPEASGYLAMAVPAKTSIRADWGFAYVTAGPAGIAARPVSLERVPGEATVGLLDVDTWDPAAWNGVVVADSGVTGPIVFHDGRRTGRDAVDLPSIALDAESLNALARILPDARNAMSWRTSARNQRMGGMLGSPTDGSLSFEPFLDEEV